MKIYRALKTNWLTQGFGENGHPVYKEWGMDGHNGYDWFCRPGEDLYYDVNRPGLVLETHTDPSGGLGVVIITEERGKHYKHRYWHLKDFAVKPGQIVKAGHFLGHGDTTGIATGPHLHRDLKEVRKEPNGHYTTLNHSNGYFGAIPMDEWYQNDFVLDQLGRVHRLVGMFPFLRKVLYPLIYKV